MITSTYLWLDVNFKWQTLCLKCYIYTCSITWFSNPKEYTCLSGALYRRRFAGGSLSHLYNCYKNIFLKSFIQSYYNLTTVHYVYIYYGRATVAPRSRHGRATVAPRSRHGRTTVALRSHYGRTTFALQSYYSLTSLPRSVWQQVHIEVTLQYIRVSKVKCQSYLCN